VVTAAAALSALPSPAAAAGLKLAPDPAATNNTGPPAKVSCSSSTRGGGSSSSSTAADESLECVGAAGAVEECKAASSLSAACHVTLWTVLCGFPAAAGQAGAYAHFKCREMRMCDVLCMLIYAVGLVPSFSRVLLLLVQGYTTSQLLKACFRVLVLASMFAVRALVLASSTWLQHFGSLQRWRSVVLASAIPVIFFVPAVTVVCGGVWCDAAQTTVGMYYKHTTSTIATSGCSGSSAATPPANTSNPAHCTPTAHLRRPWRVQHHQLAVPAARCHAAAHNSLQLRKPSAPAPNQQPLLAPAQPQQQ
jgi:hypothetical protein